MCETRTVRNLMVMLQLFCLAWDFGLSLKTDEQKLLDIIFTDDYDPVVRPVYNVSHVVQVTLQFTITRLDNVDAKEQAMTVTGWTVATWKDERLTWKPVDHNDVTTVIVKPQMVWLPDFALINRERVKDSTVTTNELISSATGKLYRDDQWEIFHPRILHTGEVRQIVGGRFSSKCLINIASYPFDEQRCSLNFENWMYTTQEVELLPVENLTREELLSSYSPSGEWEMLNVWHERKVMEYCCPPIFFSSVNFVLHMKRKPLYYVMNVVVPAIMLSLLVLLVLRLPPESGEKISMGVTLLLSFAVYILMVSENVPNTSEGVPLIVIYLMLCMVITGMTVAVTVFVLRLYHQHDRQPPACLSQAARRLARLLRIQLPRRTSSAHVVPNETSAAGRSGAGFADSSRNGHGHDKYEDVRFSNFTENGVGPDKQKEIIAGGKSSKEGLTTIRVLSVARDGDIQAEYKFIASVTDAFFAWLFLGLLLLGTVAIFLVAPNFIE